MLTPNGPSFEVGMRQLEYIGLGEFVLADDLLDRDMAWYALLNRWAQYFADKDNAGLVARACDGCSSDSDKSEMWYEGRA